MFASERNFRSCAPRMHIGHWRAEDDRQGRARAIAEGLDEPFTGSMTRLMPHIARRPWSVLVPLYAFAVTAHAQQTAATKPASDPTSMLATRIQQVMDRPDFKHAMFGIALYFRLFSPLGHAERYLETPAETVAG